MDTSTHSPRVYSERKFPVVGIGASAGGLDAFKKLLGAIPRESGVAYMLVQHSAPDRESVLPELLQKITSIPVSEITDEVKVLPDHIYIIPPNKLLVANDGVLQLSPRPAEGISLPIDLFFTSLAEVHEMQAIGVVLSGTASDGTAGLKAIKEHGGFTFAQDEGSAQFSSMPLSATNAGVVDFILPPDEIPGKIAELKQQLCSDDELEDLHQNDQDTFREILFLLRRRKGSDFTYYKQTTIRRRILRRMALMKVGTLGGYLRFLKEHSEESEALYSDLLIPVTEFFRDPKIFENLCNSVFPLLIASKLPGEPIRIWVTACSTGEEAYSIAMCLKEFLGDKQEKVQIFATDINELSIVKARRGIYEKRAMTGVSPARLQAFFTKTNGSYQINKDVRNMCVFATHNFLRDAPFSRMDFVSCRNVLIYLQPYLQKRALTTFHYTLKADGLLLLGKSETVSSIPELFAPANKSDKLFTRKNAPAKFPQLSLMGDKEGLRQPIVNAQNENMHTDFQKTADDILLSQYTPAGVVVNDTMDIVHFRGALDSYVGPAQGKPTHNLLKMARNGLAFELRNIIHKAKKEKARVVKKGILLKGANGQHNVTIEAIPLPNIIEPHYLILFYGTAEPSVAAAVKTASGKKDEAQHRIAELEKELAQAREDMRSITEDQEAVNEELQSANEELLSSSEEMQSLNEELETSKEELQSSNEELTIVNQEIIGLNDQLMESHHYSEAIIATMHTPLIVLDKNLRVKSSNAAFYSAFRVTEVDTEGKLIYELGNGQWNIEALRILLEKLLPEKLKVVDYEVQHLFPTLGERIMVLNGRELHRADSNEKLILLSIEDVTELKFAAQNLIRARENLRNIILKAPVAMCIFTGPNHIVEIANDRMLEFWGKATEDVILKSVNEGLPDVFDDGCKASLDNVYNTGHTFAAQEIPINLLRKGTIQPVYISLVHEAYREVDGFISGIITVVADVTAQVIARQKTEMVVSERTAELTAANTELAKTNNELHSFSYVASHDLQEPLRKIETFAEMIITKDYSILSDTAKDYFRRMQRATSRMKTLLEDLLTYSQTNTHERVFEKIDLNVLVAEVLSELEETILDKNAKIEIDTLGEAWINQSQFRQVLHNLIGNSLKFTRAGVMPLITIKCDTAEGAALHAEHPSSPLAKLSPGTTYRHLTFTDNGIGFKKQYNELIFEVFQRLHSDLQFPGTGIGLAIVKKIIEHHRGVITAFGEEEKGVTINIYLPINENA